VTDATAVLSTLPTFELTGPLPTGTAVLEASAGTGKTYAIAALATRYVAEAGVPLSELLLVTFTRAATAELGDRVRRRLRDAALHLEATLTGERAGVGVPEPTGDPLLDHLVDAPRRDRVLRHRRLVDALTAFDTATIATIHGFCQQMLRAIGLASAVDRDATLLDDEEALLDQVVADLVVARFHDHAGVPGLAAIRAAVTAAVRAPDAMVLPAEEPTPLPPLSELVDADELAALDDPEEAGRRLAELTRAVRDELARRKRAHGWLSQDDLLTHLRDALTDPAVGPTAVAALRHRTRIALVDEFQDTDPVQWEILRTAFGEHGHRSEGRALVLIGDPKQAIYGFRGADVRAYLDATASTEARTGLTTNWRSDGPLVDALDGLFAGTTYGEADIVHRRVEAAPRNQAPRLAATDPADATPLEVRAITRLGTSSKAPGIGEVRAQLLPSDVAAEVVHTLQDRGMTIEGRPVVPGDIAILVRANGDAPPIQRALREAQVPSVLNGVGNVFASEAADAWQALLDATDRPSDVRLARRFVVCGLGGWDGARLAAADDRAWDDLHGHLARWADVLRSRGVTALLRTVAAATDLPGRALRDVGGERLLTDVQHVGELLEHARLEGDLGPAALRGWLEEHRADADDGEVPPEAQARRLESDADAVQLLTVHRAKGLEFPLVFCPTAWSSRQAPSAPLTVHDPTTGRRLVDVGPKERAGFDAHQGLARTSQVGEDLRLLYVALTRARHRVVVWWVAADRANGSALGQVLFSREDGEVVAGPTRPPGHTEVVAVLDDLLPGIGGRVVEVPGVVEVPTYRPGTPTDLQLAAADPRGSIDRTWRRTSYSGLTAAVGHGARTVHDTDVPDLPASRDHDGEAGVVDDETLTPTPTDAHPEGTADDGRALGEVRLPLAEVPGSAELGTMLHAVLEHADFAAADLRGELGHHLEVQAARAGIRDHLDALLDGLVAAVTSPLGPILDGAALRDVTRRDRLDEPRFELPLAGGDRDAGRPAFALAQVASLLEQHLPADDPLASYHHRLRDPAFRLDVRGYLNGAIDLVLRQRGADGTPRYVIVDHKTNRLGWPDTPTALHYRPAALAEAMMDGHYPLQALLYGVALHRMLRWRLPGYDPDRHLGGIAYLFLRGMTGPDVPHVDGAPCGVFAWRPPTPLLLALDAAVAGRPATGGDA
jgi:exodeoxyribonuclease V beta subunit